VGENDAIADLEARVAKMRALGVTRWGDIELGPVPQSEAKVETQSKSPDRREREARDEQRRIALSASGRLVPRLGEDRIE
jgi:hypothetical protein